MIPVTGRERGRVRKGVIPAGGLGTRFLPATKAQPKEMLTVIDKPAIQYVVEEAVAAGIDDIVVVTSRGKGTLEDHFDLSPELEQELEAAGKTTALAQVRAVAELAQLHYVRQREPRGLGHAVWVARHHVGDEPFAVLLPDELMVDDAALMNALVDARQRHGGSVVAFMEVPLGQIAAYGCPRLAPDPVGDGLVRVAGMVEKPAPADAPSNLATTGRYVFSPKIFDALEQVPPGQGGEIQLTDAITLLLEDEPVYGYVFQGGRHDVGKPLDYLRATVALAARRPDLGPEFRAFLAELVGRTGSG